MKREVSSDSGPLWRTLVNLWPYIWPTDRPDLKGRVLLSLLKKPTQIPALVHTARTSNKAFAELLRCRDLCGVGIAGLDL